MLSNRRTDRAELESILQGWAGFVKRRIRLVACGGTALTLLELKDSTRDVDFLVPERKEYDRLIDVLERIGYGRLTGTSWAHPRDGLRFDLFLGNKVFVTELLESPLLDSNSEPWKLFGKIEVRTLNPYDLVISKMFRGTSADIEDSVTVLRGSQVRVKARELLERYKETASYDVSEEKVMRNLDMLIEALREYGAEFKSFMEAYTKWRKS